VVAGRFLYNNFCQAINNLTTLPPQLEAAKKLYNIPSDNVFNQWLEEEEAYLLALKHEPPENILKVEYFTALPKLAAAE
jgi:hypothetical protein